LGFHEFSLSQLLEPLLVFGQLLLLEVLNAFDSGMFEGLADEDLEDGLNLELEVEEIRVPVLDLCALDLPVRNRNEYRRRLS